MLESGDYGAICGGAIRSTESGLVVVSEKFLDRELWGCPILLEDGTLVAEPEDDACDELEEAMGELWEDGHHFAHPAAIVEHAKDHWRMLLPNLWLGNMRGALFALGFPIDAASFRPDGERLLVLTPQGMLVVDVDDKRISWRASLDVLQ